MKVNENYLILSVIIVFMVALYNHLAQMSCVGIKCLQYTDDGRILIVLSVIILTIINKFIGLVAAVLFMFLFGVYSNDNDMVTDKYNCKVIDNIINMDNALKERRDEKPKKADAATQPFTGSFHSTPSSLINAVTDKIPPLNMNRMADVFF